MTTPADRGYLIKNLSIASTKAILCRSSKDRILTIAKQAIKDFIYQFFASDAGKGVLEAISPDAVNFVINKSFDPQTDHTKKKLQLASFFEEVKEEMPCILIVDSGCKYVPSGISPLDRTTYVDEKFETVFRVMREIPITIAIASEDEETTSQLLILLEFLFGELRSFMDGDQLVSSDDQGEWVITLPRLLDSENITATSTPELQGDPKSRIWRTSITFPNPVIYEDVIKVEETKMNFDVSHSYKEPELSIIFPSTMHINEPIQVNIPHYDKITMKITISDARVATIDPNTFLITPRNYGTFEIRVLSRQIADTQINTSIAPIMPANNGFPPKILARHLVTITV